MSSRKTLFAITMLIIITQTLLYSLNPAHSSTYAYNPIQATTHPVNPPLTLACYPGTVPYDITRVSQGASGYIYTDFETSTKWKTNGGTWSTTTGYKGYGVQGTDDDGGLGGASQYYYNKRLTMSTGWVTVKTKLISGTGWYGLAILDRGLSAMYTVEINSTGYLEIWYYPVPYYPYWIRLSNISISTYSSSSWYILVVSFSFNNTNAVITAYIYDENGVLLASVSYNGQNYMGEIPVYYGLDVDGVTAVFDDFMVSTSDPRYIVFQGVPVGYGVSVYDASGSLVNSTVSTGGDTLLGVVSDTVVGTGSGGSIIVSYPEGLPALNYTVPLDDAVLGGDVYSVSAMTPSCTLGANSTSASVSARISSSTSKVTGGILLRLSNNDDKSLYARLILDDYTVPNTLTVNLTIASRDGQATPPIIITSSAVASNTTGWFTIPAGSTAYLYVKGYFSSANQAATLKVYIQYCTLAGGGGACTYYPVLVNFTS